MTAPYRLTIAGPRQSPKDVFRGMKVCERNRYKSSGDQVEELYVSMPKTFRSGVDRDLITMNDDNDDINEIMMGLATVTVSQRIQNSVTDSRSESINQSISQSVSHLKAHGCRTIGCPIPRPRVLPNGS